MEYLSIKYIVLELFGYKMSLIELVSVFFGLISGWLAIKENIHTWTIGILNVIGFFIIFASLKLYSSMILQVFFFIISIQGIYQWNKKDELKISELSMNENAKLILHGLLISFLVGFIMSKFNSSNPYLDAIIGVLSIFATYLMAYKKMFCWSLWFIVDVIACIVYFNKGIPLIAIEYFIFMILAIKGYNNWSKILFKNQIQHKENNI